MPATDSAPGPDLTRRSTFASWTRDSIRYRDLDPNFHVNNGAVNEYFEDGRVRFRAERMSHLSQTLLAGFALVKYSAHYRAQIRFPGDVDIGTVVLKVGNSSYVLGQGIFVDETCVATAEVVTVYIDHATGRSTPLPAEIRAILEASGPPR
ncbi:MAG: thioesterase family protein [Burkholderiaceae bacterium]